MRLARLGHLVRRGLQGQRAWVWGVGLLAALTVFPVEIGRAHV